MPYYSDLSTPSTSYLSYYTPGPYSNHSSILASNYSSPYKSVIPRNYRGYKPHLATISEVKSGLRRINSPKLLINTSPKITIPKPRKINTADIDVSSNKYKKYNAAPKPKPPEERSSPIKEQKSPSPSSSFKEARSSTEEKEAKPNTNIRRDRATVRLKTIHTDVIKNDLNAIKSWRDNFEPDELNTKEKIQKKTPGEILVEKFLIRSRSKDNILKQQKVSRKQSVKKAIPKVPSFKDICTQISSAPVDDELNPGQPMEIQRRQSRQFSSEDIIGALRRNSKDLTEDDVKLLDHILDENDNITTIDDLNLEESKKKSKTEKNESRGSVRKKKIAKKKSNELLVDSASESDRSKSPIQRRPTKKLRRTSTDSSLPSSDIIDENEEESIRDISQVEIETIKVKPKPVITATVDVEEKSTLKPVIDEVEIEESPKRKKGKMFRFNVIVEEVEEKKRASRSRSNTPAKDLDPGLKCRTRPNTPTEEFKSPLKRKPSVKTVEKVKVNLPKGKEPVISNIVRRKSDVQLGDILEDVKELPPENTKNEAVQKKELVNKNDAFNKSLDASKEKIEEKVNSLSNCSEKITSTTKAEEKDIQENGTLTKKEEIKLKSQTSQENETKVDAKPSFLKKQEVPKIKSQFSQENDKKTEEKVLQKKEETVKVSPPFLNKQNLFSKHTSEIPKSEDKEINKRELSTEVAPISQQNDKKFDGKSIAEKKDEPAKVTSQLPSKQNIFSKSSAEIIKPKLEDKTNLLSKSSANLTQVKSKVENKTADLPPKTDTMSKSNVEISQGKFEDKTSNLSKSSSDIQKTGKTRGILKKETKEFVVKEDGKDKVVEDAKKTETEEVKNLNKEKVEAEKEEKTDNKLHLKIDKKDSEEGEQDGEPKTDESESPLPNKITSKRSLIKKANKSDPDLAVFRVPSEVLIEEEAREEESKDTFVPLQSNRLSGFMNPWKKPEQYDECPVEIYARPKPIKGRHIPRRWQPAVQEDSSDDSSSEDSDSSSEEETSSDEGDEGASKIGASTSSNDSGFDSEVKGGRNKDCDVNCHKKCEKLTANLCGVNQKLVVEAIELVKKGSSTDARDSPNLSANNPAFNPEEEEPENEYTQSSTFLGFQRSGRITPPATTIPRFRKYAVEDFNFLKVLGKGSFGKVLLAELKDTEYYYAIKCLKKDVVLEDDDVECTLIERKVLALGTKHPYLCHLLCTFQTDSHLFFVMEYLNGGDLMWHIQASGRFEEDRARFYGAEIVSGLKFLHNKGIVYRDLKLDNILLDYDGHVRIADFGMCKLQIFLDRMADTFCGTPDYMAPEIIKGQHYNQCVDWWSFGVLLYEMLIGQSPFSGCDEDELFWSICNEKPVIPRFLSRDAHDVLVKFLEKDWNKRLGNRFASTGDIQDQPFFKPIDWQALESRQLEPPFKPCLLHPLDTQYFDKTFTREKAKITPIEQPILQSMDQTQFQGFSYTNPNATDK